MLKFLAITSAINAAIIMIMTMVAVSSMDRNFILAFCCAIIYHLGVYFYVSSLKRRADRDLAVAVETLEAFKKAYDNFVREKEGKDNDKETR